MVWVVIFTHDIRISTYVLFNTAHRAAFRVLYYIDMLSMRCMKMNF